MPPLWTVGARIPNIGIPNNFEVQISNGLVLEWSVVIAMAMVLTILKPNHWKSVQNGGHFVWISYSFVLNGRHFVQNRTQMENRPKGDDWNSQHIQYSSPHCTLLTNCFVKLNLNKKITLTWVSKIIFYLIVNIYVQF